MDSSVSGKDEIWFLRVCHHVPHELYYPFKRCQVPVGHSVYLVTVGGRRTSGQYFYKYSFPTNWRASSSDKYLSNVPVVGNRLDETSNNYPHHPYKYFRLTLMKPVPLATRLLRMWVRIAPGAWMSFCCERCVLSGRGLCVGLITRPEESYRLWCVVVCELETSWMRSSWLNGSCCARRKRDSSKNVTCDY